jgi:hypothetical protein
MRIIMKKRKKATETFINAPKCDAPDCLELGLYKAPKRKGGGAKEYYHFCLPHVQQFNKNYDFFAGMDEDAIVNFRLLGKLVILLICAWQNLKMLWNIFYILRPSKPLALSLKKLKLRLIFLN